MSHWPNAETKKVDINLDDLFSVLTEKQIIEFKKVNARLDKRDANRELKK